MSSGPPGITEGYIAAQSGGQTNDVKEQIKANAAKNAAFAAPTPAAEAASSPAAARIQEAVGGAVTPSRPERRGRSAKKVTVGGGRDGEEAAERRGGSAMVRPKELPKIKKEPRKTVPAISLEPKEVTASTSFNSIGALNWNVTGTPNGEDDDPDDWSVNEVIFAVVEKGEEKKKRRRHRHHHDAHEDHGRVSDITDRETADRNTNALMEVEVGIATNPMLWNLNPQDFGLGIKIENKGIHATNVATISRDHLRRSHSAVNQSEDSSWSFPGAEDRIRPSNSIEDAFQSEATRKSKSSKREKTEDVESIISTALSETKDGVAKKKDQVNIRKRIGLAVVGVAMVCGIVGVAVTSEDWTNNDSDSDLSSNGDVRDDDGGSGGSGRGVPSGRSRGETSGCPDPLTTLSTLSFFASNQTTNIMPNMTCSMDKERSNKESSNKESSNYKVGSLCLFSCGTNQRLEGPNFIRCRHYNDTKSSFFWCHVVPTQDCRDIDFQLTPSKCVAEQKTAASGKSRERRLLTLNSEQKNNTGQRTTMAKLLADRSAITETFAAMSSMNTGGCTDCSGRGTCIQMMGREESTFCDCNVRLGKPTLGGVSCNKEPLTIESGPSNLWNGKLGDCAAVTSKSEFPLQSPAKVTRVLVLTSPDAAISIFVKSENSIVPCRQVGVSSVFIVGEQKTSSETNIFKHSFSCDGFVLASVVFMDVRASSSSPSTQASKADVKVCEVIVFD